MSLPALRIRAFPLLLAAFVALAIAYSVVVPLGEAPDEVSHFAYIVDLLRNHALPEGKGAVTGEAHQPPLYYLIGAMSTIWTQTEDWEAVANPDYTLGDPQTPNLLIHTREEAFPYRGPALAWHLVRLLSILMGAATVWATWRIALLLLGGDRVVALGSAAFVAFLPEFTFLSGMANNDNLIILLSALSILQLLRMRDRPTSKRDPILLGILVGLATLTKLSGLILWPFVSVLILIWGARSGRIRIAILNLALFLGPAFVVVSPWLAYNFVNYGDPIGWSKLLVVTPSRQAMMTLDDWLGIFRGLATSFAGRFGGALQLRLTPVYYRVFWLGMLLSVAGWLGYLKDAQLGRFPGRLRGFLLLSGIFWLLMIAGYARWTMTVLGTDQARQLFPGLPLFAVFLTVGVARLARTHHDRIVGALIVAMVVSSAGALFFLNSVYTTQLEFEKFDDSSRRGDFGRIIRIRDFDLLQTQASPGDSIGVQVQWQALGEPKENYWLILNLAGPFRTIADKEGVPSAGRLTTDWWQAGQVLSSRHTLVVPANLAPGLYTLKLGLHPYGRKEMLKMDGEDWLILGNVTIRPKPGG